MAVKMYYNPVTEGGKVTPQMIIIKKTAKIGCHIHEKVDKLPGRSEGIIKGLGDKKRITKVLKDC